MSILISGSSNVGKTTFATGLAQKLGWKLISTDNLARHPGRPWPDVSPPVQEYYSRLSDDTVYWFLMAHHENMWPSLWQRIDAEQRAQMPFILEGAALRPEYIAPLLSSNVCGVFLYADNDVLQWRMRGQARYSESDDAGRCVIDRFVNRSLRDNTAMQVSASKHGMKMVDTTDSFAMAGLFDALVNWAVNQVPLETGQ